jgi:WD40 repeat protein
MENTWKENTPFLFFTGKEKEYITKDEVLCLDVNTSRNLLAFGLDNRNVTIKYLDTLEDYFSSTEHEMYVWCITFNKNGDLLFSGDKSGTIIKWNVDRKCNIFKKKIHKENVRDLKTHEDHLISAGDDGKIKIFDMKTMNLLEEFHTNEPCKLLINQNKIMAADYNQSLFSIDLETKMIKNHPFFQDKEENFSIWSICFYSINSFILGDNSGHLFKYKEDQIINFKKVTEDRFSEILVYEGYLISCNFDKHIRIHDIDTFEVLYSQKYEIRFNSMVIVKEKYLIASGLSKNSIIVIDLKSYIEMFKVLKKKRDLNIFFYFIE